MKNVGKKAFPENISTSDMAKLLGITVQRLGQLVAAGIVSRTSRGLYPASTVARYCEFLRGGGAEDPDKDEDGTLDLRRERAALVHIQRRIAERELARLEERFVDVNAVLAFLSKDYSAVKHRIRGLPNEMAHKLCLMKNPGEIAAYVREEIDEILTELSKGSDIVENALKENRDDQ